MVTGITIVRLLAGFPPANERRCTDAASGSKPTLREVVNNSVHFNDPKSCGRGSIPRGWRSCDLLKIKYGEFPPIPAWWLKQTSAPRCFAKGDTKYYIPLPCGCRSNNAPVQASELYTALHAKIKQREIKENLRYHESAVLNVQDGRYSHRIGKE